MIIFYRAGCCLSLRNDDRLSLFIKKEQKNQLDLE